MPDCSFHSAQDTTTGRSHAAQVPVGAGRDMARPPQQVMAVWLLERVR